MNGSIITALLFATMPTFRFSERFARPCESTAVLLTGPCGFPVLLGVQGWRQASTTVVSQQIRYVGAELSAWGMVNGWPFMRATSQTLAPCSGVRLYNARPRVVW